MWAPGPRKTGVVQDLKGTHNVELAVTITTLTSREFTQDASKAKSAAENGPVIITDQG